MDKFKKTISDKEKSLDKKINYYEHKFGDESLSSFRTKYGSSLRKKLVDAGLGEILNIILKQFKQTED